MKSTFARIAVLALLLLLGIFAVTPKLIGRGIEQATVDSLLELIPPEAENQLEIRRNEFSEGWFSSSATIELVYTAIGTDAIAMVLDFDVDHGPLIWNGEGLDFGLAHADITPAIRNDLFDIAIADLDIPLPETQIDLVVRFDQSLQLTLDVSPVEYNGASGQISFAGLEASIEVAEDQSAQMSLVMGELSAMESAANTNIVISGMELNSTTAQMNDLLAQSSAMLSIPSISSTAPVSYSVDQFTIEYGLRASADYDDSVEIFQTISVGNIEGELPLRSFSWFSEIKQLDNELVRDYYRLLSELQSETNSQDSDDPTGSAITAELSLLGEQLMLLTLQKPLELNNMIEANALEGDHSLNLTIKWAGIESLTNIAELDISEAINRLEVQLEISLDLEAILRSPLAGLVDPYVQEGYLTLANGRILIEASLADGVLQVNGEQMPIDQFF